MEKKAQNLPSMIQMNTLTWAIKIKTSELGKEMKLGFILKSQMKIEIWICSQRNWNLNQQVNLIAYVIIDSAYIFTTSDQPKEHETVSSYTDRLKRYKQENENLRQMLCVNSFEIRPQEGIKRLIARPFTAIQNQNNPKVQTSRNKW